MSASKFERNEESDAPAPLSEPRSGIHPAGLLPPRPSARALPGKEVLPAPGVPETPRRERNQTSSFWPAPPEPLQVPPPRPSKRGTPLTTTTHGFPEADLRAGAPAARKSVPPKSRLVEVEPLFDLDDIPPPPRSKRTHTDQGWPAPSGTIEPLRGTYRDTVPLLDRFEDVAGPPSSSAAVAAPLRAEAPAPEVSTPTPRPLARVAPRAAANDVVLPSLFGDDEPIELPIQRSSARGKWIAVAIVAVVLLVAVAAFVR